MNLLLRLVWILLRRSRAGRMHPLAVTKVKSRVMPNDLDFNMHVNNGRYLSFADLGRVDWFIRSGCMQVAMKNKCIPVIGDATARYMKQLKTFDRFHIHSRLLGWNDKWAFMEHRILDKHGKLAALVVIRGMFWSRKNGGMKPAELVAATGHEGLESPVLPDWVAQWSATLDTLTASSKAEAAKIA